MKELYLTVTDMTFMTEGKVLGHGRTVTAAPGPEQPGEYPAALAGGAMRMGTFRPTDPEEAPLGRWNARLEGQEGYTLTFQGERFLLGCRTARQTMPNATRRRG